MNLYKFKQFFAININKYKLIFILIKIEKI